MQSLSSQGQCLCTSCETTFYSGVSKWGPIILKTTQRLKAAPAFAVLLVQRLQALPGKFASAEGWLKVILSELHTLTSSIEARSAQACSWLSRRSTCSNKRRPPRYGRNELVSTNHHAMPSKPLTPSLHQWLAVTCN